jgi:nitric oxide reductase large subunit
VKPKLERIQFGFLWKLLLFNALILAMYGLLIHLFGMAQIAAEYRELGTVMTIVMLILGNLTFFLLDKVLTRFSKIK